MVCDAYLQEMIESRRREEEEKRVRAINGLKAGLSSGSIYIGKTVAGKEGIVGWRDRSGLCDACVFDKLREDPVMKIARMKAVAVQENKLHVGH